MDALQHVGAVAPDQAAPEWAEKGDARELGGGAGIEVQRKENGIDFLTQELASQVRLVWEAEIDGEVAHASAWRIHEAWDELREVDARPLQLGGKRRRRKRRADAGSDPSTPFGAFPKRRNTVIAEVLARLLAGETLTDMDGVVDHHTTRLADHVRRLRRLYGWRIESRDVEVCTQDGRAVPVSEYWLPPSVIAAAAAAGGAEFCGEVRAARAERRASAHGRE